MFIVRNPFSDRTCILERGKLVDEGPTMAALLGFSLPDCDGKPIAELL